MKYRFALGLLLGLGVSTLQAATNAEQVVALQQSEISKLKQTIAQMDRYAVYSTSCVAVFKDLAQWKQSSVARRVDFKIVGNKIKTPAASELNYGFGSFGEGQLVMEGANLVSTFPKYFSDRKNAAQGFNVAAPDTMKITLEPRGSGFINLVTWGNGRVDLDGVICTRDGFGAQMVARFREGNGTNMMLMSFHKGE